MQVSLHNKVKAYNLTAGKSLPEWLSERRKNKKSVAGTENRIELLHDLEFPHCARCLFRCPNGTNLFAAGDYPYRLKCFDVNELSMKYSFNADMNILSGVCLSSDYKKFALRGEGRQITIHHSAAIVDRVRVPHIQRSLILDPFHAELLSSGVSPEILRINLETGAFVESYHTQCDDGGVNSLDIFKQGPVSGLVLAGGCDGYLEAWDSRAPSAASRLNITGSGSLSGLTGGGELRHVSVEEAGSMLFACGTENGEVLLYDVRLQKPLLVKDHMNSLPIVKTYFFHGKSTSTGEASYVLSADTRALKIWRKSDGGNFTSIEAPADILDFCLLKSQHNLVAPYDCDDSGVVAICCDAPRVQVHFVPQLGVAPRWAAFLEGMTEELEEKEATTVYDDFTFVSKEEMDSLGISAQDMADGKVRPVMHGAFIENGLYRQLKAVVDPGSFNRYVAENTKKRISARWEERISRFKRSAAKDGDDGDDNDGDVAQGENGEALPRQGLSRSAALAAAKADPRFAKAFDPATGKPITPAFSLDRSNPEYAKLLQTIEERRAKASERHQRYESDMFSVIPDTEGDAYEASDPTGIEYKEDEDEDEARRHLRGVQSSGKLSTRKRKHTNASDEANGEDAREEGGGGGGQPPAPRPPLNGGKRVTMFEVNKANANLFTRNDKQIHASRKKRREDKLTLEERLRRARLA